MRKEIVKLTPGDYWQIGKIESWFSDMAKEGLILKTFRGRAARFIKGEPLMMRYRIDIAPSMEKSLEQVEIYAESGWYFVSNYEEFFVYASLAENNAPELHTDPAEQAFTLKRLLRKFSLIALLFSFLIIMNCLLLFLRLTLAVELAEGDLNSVLMFLSLFFFLYGEVKAIISVSKLKKSLSEGQPINHSVPWKKNRNFNKIVFSIYFAVFFSLAIYNIISVWSEKTEILPLSSNSLPIVRLADIEQNPEMVRGQAYMQDSVDLNNCYTYDSSCFAPAQYVTSENGIIKNEKWITDGKPGSNMYSPDIETRMFILKYSSMNEWLLSGLIKRYSATDRKNFTEISNQNYDKLMVSQQENAVELFAAKDEFVIKVLYNGNADLDTVIEAVADRIDKN